MVSTEPRNAVVAALCGFPLNKSWMELEKLLLLYLHAKAPNAWRNRAAERHWRNHKKSASAASGSCHC